MIKDQIFKEIKDEMKKNGSWRDVAYFQCYRPIAELGLN